jgi:hypothetical protein
MAAYTDWAAMKNLQTECVDQTKLKSLINNKAAKKGTFAAQTI